MKVGLFIPCYVNQFYPKVAIATLEILEKLCVDVHYPTGQTCCGQPLGNSGYEKEATGACNLFVENFKNYDCIVAPSGSCVYHVKHHFDTIVQTEEVQKVRNNIYELCEFLINILGITNVGGEFPYKVGLHNSCHGLRGLRLGASSELNIERISMAEDLLKEVKGLELVNLNRADECCGFGGTFAVVEEAISVKMGNDRIVDHIHNKAKVITATDMSCLMHLEGLVRKNKQDLKVMHIAEILNSSISS